MKLYLSSYRIGDYPEKLAEIAGGRPVAIISNALDFIPDEARRRYEAEVYNPRREFADLGLDATALDLRLYFGRADALQAALQEFGLVWVMGGNAFLLMRAIRQSGFDKVVRGLLTADEISYGGFSAGAVVATPTLRGIELMDQPDQLAAGYRSEVEWDGMGLVEFSVVPHYRSDHPEADAAERALACMETNGFPHLAMADGDVYFASGGAGGLLRKRT